MGVEVGLWVAVEVGMKEREGGMVGLRVKMETGKGVEGVVTKGGGVNAKTVGAIVKMVVTEGVGSDELAGASVVGSTVEDCSVGGAVVGRLVVEGAGANVLLGAVVMGSSVTGSGRTWPVGAGVKGATSPTSGKQGGGRERGAIVLSFFNRSFRMRFLLSTISGYREIASFMPPSLFSILQDLSLCLKYHGRISATLDEV